MTPRDIQPTLRGSVIALTVTLLLQIFTSLSATATAVLAPEIGREFALSPKLIGFFVGLIYMASMASSLVSGQFIERYGAIRVSQACVVFCAAGIALMPLIPTASSMGLAMLVFAALVIGIGYGPITPASSHILARTTPPARMGLTFSIKQTGVPAGAAIAGAVLPGLAVEYGWRGTFAAVAALGVLIALSAQPTRTHLDNDRRAGRRLALAQMVAPLRLLVKNRTLMELSITGFIYAATQVCLTSFLVVYLTEALGLSLIAAGIALTVTSIGGIVGRIVFGITADRWLRPRVTLGIIGTIAGICAYTTMAFDARWPMPIMLAVCGLFGSTAIGWNGVQLSEIARHAPPGQAGPMTGASGFLTFAGVVLGPSAFAVLASVTGSYRAGFAVFGSLSLLNGCRLLLSARK